MERLKDQSDLAGIALRVISSESFQEQRELGSDHPQPGRATPWSSSGDDHSSGERMALARCEGTVGVSRTTLGAHNARHQGALQANCAWCRVGGDSAIDADDRVLALFRTSRQDAVRWDALPDL